MRRLRTWWQRHSTGLVWGIALHHRPRPSTPLLALSGVPGYWALTVGKRRLLWRETPTTAQDEQAS
jgi:hypothetical protein